MAKVRAEIWGERRFSVHPGCECAVVYDELKRVLVCGPKLLVHSSSYEPNQLESDFFNAGIRLCLLLLCSLT